MDSKVLDRLETEWLAELDQLVIRARRLAWPEFNPGAPEQVTKAFLNLGVPSLELEEESAVSGYSSNKKKLQALQDTTNDPKVTELVRTVLDFRNRRKMVSTYVTNAKEDLDSDGRLRYTWKQAGPVTGRTSCTFFHQIPKIDETRIAANKPVLRQAFVAPEGYSYVYGDFSQQELWIVAIISDDNEMLHILINDGDLHGATGFEFLKNYIPGCTESQLGPDHKFNRTEVGKRINFGLVYGSQGYALVKQGKWKDANGIERQFTWAMLDEGMVRWRKRFRGVGAFISDTPDLVRTCGNIAANCFGRERHFGAQLNHHNKWEREAAEREAINFFVQSVAASVTNRTIIAIDQMLEKFKISEDQICLVNTVHDSLAYEVVDYLVPWFVDAIQKISSRPFPELNNHQFKLDIGVGKNWCEAEMAA